MTRRVNPEPPRCCWCDKRFPTAAAVIAHQLEHREADRALIETGTTLRDSRALAERLAAAAAMGMESGAR